MSEIRKTITRIFKMIEEPSFDLEKFKKYPEGLDVDLEDYEKESGERPDLQKILSDIEKAKDIKQLKSLLTQLLEKL